jgi:hypothetical protein
MTDQTGGVSGPYWWRLALQDTGLAVGAHVLAHEIAADPISGDKKWYGLPTGITDKPSVPARWDELEIRLLLLLDLLTAHASAVEAGGRVLIMATLVALTSEPHARIALLNEIVDESGKRSGRRLAGYRANRPLEEVAMQPVTYRGRLVGAENLCHLGTCPRNAAGSRLSVRRRRSAQSWSGGGMIFGLWA